MNPGDSDPIDAEIREIFARTEAGSHPSSAELAAYSRDELPEQDAGRIQGHLGLCRECTAAVLALELPHLETISDQPTDAEVETDIEAIMASVRATEESALGSPLAFTANDETTSQSPRAERSRWLFAAAAVLAIACLSLALLSIKLRHQVSDLETAIAQMGETPTATMNHPLAPQTGVPIVDLFPSSVVRSDSSTVPSISLDADASRVVLILTPPAGLAPSDAYSLRILDSADRELWRGPAQLDPAGTFVLLLPRRFAEQGARQIRLYHLEEPLETFELRFEP